MADLPTVSSDIGVWGPILNAWLQTEHNADASHDSNTFIDTLDTKLLFNTKGEIITNRNGELVYLKE